MQRTQSKAKKTKTTDSFLSPRATEQKGPAFYGAMFRARGKQEFSYNGIADDDKIRFTAELAGKKDAKYLKLEFTDDDKEKNLLGSGTLFPNRFCDPAKRQPQYTGSAVIGIGSDKKPYQLAGWVKISKKDVEYLSLKFTLQLETEQGSGDLEVKFMPF